MRTLRRDAVHRDDRGPRDRFGLVFLLLITSFLTSALVTVDWVRAITAILYIAALLLALRSSDLSRTAARVARWVLSIGSVAAAILAGVTDNRQVQGAVSLWLAGILLLSIIVVVRRILNHRVVALGTIFGALSAYLLIGFLFAAVFTAVARFDPQPFFASGGPVNGRTIQYFSFVTLTTTGYGDFTAATGEGRTLAVLEALSGQIFLVTLVARLVSLFGTDRPSRGRTAMPREEKAEGSDFTRSG